jgi:ClpP class serine protease
MNNHKLLKITASLKNKPHLISKEAFDTIQTYLASRNAGMMTFTDDQEENSTFESVGDIGVIQIRGPLTYRTTGWEAYCGGYSYEMLLDSVTQLAAKGVKTIVLDCDSGGGEAYSMIETTDEIRSICDANDIKLFGYIDGSACSAMYGIVCSCDEVVANPQAEVGSIGVLICLYNDQKALEQAGYERTFITDGTDKVPFADDGSWREGFLEDLQQKVTKLGDEFRSHVSKYTGLSVEDLKNTQARVYDAQTALEMGLVNSIMTRSDFIDYVLTRGAN